MTGGAAIIQVGSRWRSLHDQMKPLSEREDCPGVLCQGGLRSQGKLIGLFTQGGTDYCLFEFRVWMLNFDGRNGDREEECELDEEEMENIPRDELNTDLQLKTDNMNWITILLKYGLICL